MQAWSWPRGLGAGQFLCIFPLLTSFTLKGLLSVFSGKPLACFLFEKLETSVQSSSVTCMIFSSLLGKRARKIWMCLLKEKELVCLMPRGACMPEAKTEVQDASCGAAMISEQRCWRTGPGNPRCCLGSRDRFFLDQKKKTKTTLHSWSS